MKDFLDEYGAIIIFAGLFAIVLLSGCTTLPETIKGAPVRYVHSDSEAQGWIDHACDPYCVVVNLSGTDDVWCTLQHEGNHLHNDGHHLWFIQWHDGPHTGCGWGWEYLIDDPVQGKNSAGARTDVTGVCVDLHHCQLRGRHGWRGAVPCFCGRLIPVPTFPRVLPQQHQHAA